MATAAAADVIGSLDDLLIQILLLLPLKSLMRFKLVSKHWKSLITSHRFSLLRYPSPDPVAGLFVLAHKFEYDYDYIPLDANPNPTNKPPFRVEFPGKPYPWVSFPYAIKQSCNGLLLCISIDGYFSEPPPHSCYVYNPTAKSFAEIPQPGVTDGDQWSMYGLNLAFNPTESPFYKVICVRGSGFVRNTYQIEVYSSESGEWRVSGEPFRKEAFFGHGVYWNGSIHWTNERMLLYFNLNNEEIGQVALPAAIEDEDRGIAYFGESCDHLHIIVTMDKKYTLDIYEMKRDYSEWFAVYRVDMTLAVECHTKLYEDDESGEDDLRDYYQHFVLCLVRAEEEKKSFLVLHGEGGVLRCNLHDNSLEDICGVKDDRDVDDGWDDGDVVVETWLQCDYDFRDRFKPGDSIAAPLAFEHVNTLVGV